MTPFIKLVLTFKKELVKKKEKKQKFTFMFTL